MRRHTRRLFPIPIKLLIWINGIWRSVKGNRNCLGSTQRKKSRNAITRTGIVPAAATAKMKRISRTTCGTVHDVHFARYANFPDSYSVAPPCLTVWNQWRLAKPTAFSRSLA